jgi:bifunctional DNA-binding transcriptional regulator/antitoxin component of YhaV-PrlF toxin-antitoxin module
MLAKMTSKNQLTLPKSVVSQFPGSQYFEVRAEYGRIILEPVNTKPLSAVREKLESLGISEDDVGDAVKWSRR